MKLKKYLLESKENYFKMTNNQVQMCKDYLKGKLKEKDIHMVYKTYINDYIAIFGWDSTQKDSIKTIITNFCKSVIKSTLTKLFRVIPIDLIVSYLLKSRCLNK